MSAVTLLAVLASLPADAPTDETADMVVLGDTAGDHDRFIHFFPTRPDLGIEGVYSQHMTRHDATGRSWSAVGGKFTRTASGEFVAVTA
jgi:hypothetical protein